MVGGHRPKLSELARRYFGGMAHNHTTLSNHPNHHESNLSVDRFTETLVEAGLAGRPEAPLQYLMLNEHASNPSRPRRLGRLSLRGRQLLRQRGRPIVHRVPVFYGLEASLLPGGQTDLTPHLADHCALIIASRHALPADIERDPAVIMELFRMACHNPVAEVLGHPPRYIEDLPEVDWPLVFTWAAETGTAIEVNLNAFPGANANKQQQTFWSQWLKMLAASKATIFIGTDIHSKYQLDEFVLQWRSLDQAASRYDNQLACFIEALQKAGIVPERAVTADYNRLMEWLQMDKPARAQLPLNK